MGRPSPRDSAAGVFLPEAGQLLVFGGENAGAVLGDTWLWSRADGAWRRSPALGPAARAGSTAVYDSARGVVVLFGGVSGPPDAPTYQNDVWEYAPAQNRWLVRSTGSARPTPRAYAAACFDSVSNRALLFGGTGASDFSDTWQWDPGPGTWSQVASSGPPARGGGSLACDTQRRRAVLFGGALSDASGAALNDTWEFALDTGQWIARTTVAAPAPRTGHASIYDSVRQRVLVHGGTTPDALNASEVWQFEASEGTWQLLSGAATHPGRTGHILAFDASTGRMLASGGLEYSASGRFTPAFADVWEYDTASSTWLDRTQELAPGQLEPGAAYDVARERIVARSAPVTGHPRPFVWEYDTRSARWLAADATANQPNYATDLFRPPLTHTSLLYDTTRQRTAFLSGQAAASTYRVQEWDGEHWAQRCQAVSPVARDSGSVVFLPDRGVFLLFGGYASTGTSPRNDVLELDPGNCSAIETGLNASPEPSARIYPAAAWDSIRRRMLIFGGANGATYDSDAWEWDPVSASWTLLPSGPPARMKAALVFDSARRIFVLYGGSNAAGGLTDTWEFDPETGTWSDRTDQFGDRPAALAAGIFDTAAGKVGLQETSGALWHWTGSTWQRRTAFTVPAARSGGAGGFVPHRGFAVLFGGTSGDGQRDFLQDTWLWNGSWSLLGSASSNQSPSSWRPGGLRTPPARTGHVLGLGYRASSSAQQGLGLLFGGEGDGGLLNDTWTFDDQTFDWKEQPGLQPPARTEHALSVMPLSGYVMHGGLGASGALEDTWMWQPSSGWDQVSFSGIPGPQAPHPSVRHGHAMATDTQRGQVILFGGRSATGLLNDTWIFNLAATFDEERWTRATPATSPSPRSGHRMTYDSVRQRIVLTGGSGASGESTLSDTWEWDGAVQTWIPRGVETFPARAGHTAFFDETRSLLMVFGGLAYRNGGAAASSYGDMLGYVGAGNADPLHGRQTGSPCSRADQCTTGQCVDGYCCNSACTEQCAACNVTGAEGLCTAVTGSPVGNRPTCGNGTECSLRCNGLDVTACHLPPAGQACGPATGCSGGFVVHARGSCDGAGLCNAGSQTSCEPYKCCSPPNCSEFRCATACSTHEDCFSTDYYCGQAGGFPPIKRCQRLSRLTSFTVEPANPSVGVLLRMSAQAADSATFSFSYRVGDGPRTWPCINSFGVTGSCEFTPGIAGQYTLRAEVRGNDSPNIFDDFREISTTVAP
ncbi:MAG TPA: kelch repeat-containing protein [Polyangiaceae bacterium]